MRILGVAALCAALGGCAASKQEVATRLGDQYVGQNVDALVVKFGPPANTFLITGPTRSATDISGGPDADRRDAGGGSLSSWRS